jgi:hypothetical protein
MGDLLWFIVLLIAICTVIGAGIVITGSRGDGYFCEDCGCLSEIHCDGKCTRQGCRCGLSDREDG